jgi:histone acetyltransferase 1
MEVLLLFYIDGVSFVFEEIDTWLYFLVFKKIKGTERKLFVGMLSKYVFRLSTIKERHRISQVFILPTYQKSGHGKELIDTIYNISLNDPRCFEITTEIPSFEYQCLRDFKELELILNSKIIDISLMKKVINKTEIEENKALLLTKENVRKIKEQLKIPGHQIERLINILIYHKIQSQNEDMPKAYF